mmetsp:Transcript_44678/g.105873  ORF Transcript_44678/g.105873 Transcript_44678/m.105873 type:complete len:246 (-) Transcript_44678:674-1411(-)
MEAFFLDKVRHPVRSLVVLDKLLLDRLHLDEPRRHSLVDERRIRAPAEGVAMLDRTRLDQPAASFDVSKDRLVSLLHVLLHKVRHLVCEAAVVVDRARHALSLLDHPVRQTHPVIVLSECRRLVHDAGTTRVRDVRVREHPVGGVALGRNKVREERLVLEPYQLGAEARLHHRVLRRLLEYLDDAGGGHDVDGLRLLILDGGVLHGRVHAEREVRGQRPRSGCPGEEGGWGLHVLDREGHHALWV